MDFSSRIFIDGGDPEETRQANEMLKKAGYHGLDGQTTNPTLIAKNFAAQHAGAKVTMEEAVGEYRRVVTQMSKIIPQGSISIQVLGDPATLTTEQMVSQARDRIGWIPNASIKFPCTTAGLAGAEIFCQEGPVNITLNFSQEQAAGVYVATKAHSADKEVFISPFVGRLDDRGEKGMDVVANILEMYRGIGDGFTRRSLGEGGHVKVLTASVRNLKHVMYALWLKSDIISIPFKIFTQWADQKFAMPSADFIYDVPGLTEIPYKELTLDKEWKEYDLQHELTDAGLTRFWEDWKAIVSA